uniref:Uncharacterized protein n=1 Tax=Timema poppense TaxID=170557 RepID=A0A7R9CYI5_TIMPO|nr:unnamed protein product [Timema poppensis]
MSALLRIKLVALNVMNKDSTELAKTDGSCHNRCQRHHLTIIQSSPQLGARTGGRLVSKNMDNYQVYQNDGCHRHRGRNSCKGHRRLQKRFISDLGECNEEQEEKKTSCSTTLDLLIKLLGFKYRAWKFLSKFFANCISGTV